MKLPSKIKTVHLMGVCGTGMGAFAGLLKQAGYEVRGSDQGVYPPMSDKLKDWGVEIRSPYGPANLDPAPDLVVVGNVIPKVNPEATAMRERELAHASFPATFGELFLKGRHPVVVAGTHGKTTTTSVLAHVLMSAGRDPGYLIGGIPHGFEESFREGARTGQTPVVVEGDEYDTAYFDKGPKFLHYQPKSLMVTSLEFDHADIYDSIGQIRSRFEQVLALVPKDGHIVVHAPAEELALAVKNAKPSARVETYGEGGEHRADDVVDGPDGLRFSVVSKGKDKGREFKVPLNGQHNLQNVLGAITILRGLGLSDSEIADGLATFPGVKRRMEISGEENGVTVIDDFAHHPTAVGLTIAGAKAKYKGRPLWAIFEPRSATSCRKIFQDDYAESFGDADRVLLAPPGRQLDPSEALDVPKLARDIADGGVPADACPDIDAVVAAVAKECPARAVLLVMSNGSFGGIHKRLLDAVSKLEFSS